jgi:hypothetical protein
MSDEENDPPEDAQSPWERFEQFAKRIFAVPKKEVEELREREKGDQD